MEKSSAHFLAHSASLPQIEHVGQTTGSVLHQDNIDMLLSDIALSVGQLNQKNANHVGRMPNRMSFSEIIEVDEESLDSSVMINDRQIQGVFLSKQTNPATTQNSADIRLFEVEGDLTPQGMILDGLDDGSMRKAMSQQNDQLCSRLERKAIAEEWRMLKSYESFIVQVIFELGIMNRLYDFRTFLEIASEKHAKMKKSKEEVTERQKQESPKTDTPKTILKVEPSVSQQKKRVTLVVPDKDVLADELTRHIKVLTEGKWFEKYCMNSSKIETVFANFSIDCKHFAWRLHDKDEPHTLPMSELQELRIGRTSRNFKKYVRKGESPDDGRSFSLIFARRTIDLVADTEQDRRQFTEAIEKLRKFA